MNEGHNHFKWHEKKRRIKKHSGWSWGDEEEQFGFLGIEYSFFFSLYIQMQINDINEV